MGDTSIEWCDYTFNPWIGCTKISPGCANCYASVDTYARVSRGRGLELWGRDAGRHVTGADNWRKPRKWNREAEAAGKRRRVFCASLADVFEDRPDLVEPRARLFSLIRETPALDWLLLTKRPENADRLWKQAQRDAIVGALDPATAWLSNIWLGTTAEDQKRADERIPHLLATPAKVRFLSCEPLLEKVDLAPWMNRFCDGTPMCGACCHKYPQHGPCDHFYRPECPRCKGSGRAPGCIDWVIVGGESGGGARTFDLAWARSIVKECKAAGVAVFMKQFGADPIDGLAGCSVWQPDRKGGDPAHWPEELRVRQWPTVSP